MRENHPKDFILQHQRIEYFADKFFPKAIPEYVPTFNEFDIPEVLSGWVNDNVINPVFIQLGIHRPARPKSLIIIGASRTGKTSWARSLGPHAYFNGYFSGSRLLARLEGSGYAVFDDTPLDRIINAKGWFGAQEEFTITDKYCPKTVVKWGRPSIFLINRDMDYRNYDLWDYIQMNSVLYVMSPGEKFY